MKRSSRWVSAWISGHDAWRAGLWVAACLVLVTSGARAQDPPVPLPDPPPDFKLHSGLGQFDVPTTLPVVPFLDDLAKPHLKKAEAALATGQWDQVIAHATRAIENDLFSIDGYRSRALALVQKQLYRQAIADWNAVLRFESHDWCSFTMRGRCYCEERDYRRALVDFDAALLVACDDASRSTIHVDRGVVFLQQGDYQRAIDEFDRSIKLTPSNPVCFSQRGKAFAKLGDHSRAIADFDQSIELSSSPAPMIWVSRAASLFALGKYVLAQSSYGQAIDLNPNDSLAHVGQGLVRLVQGQMDGSIEDFDRAIALDSDCGAAYSGRGWAALAKHDWKQAVVDFDQAIAHQASGSLTFYWFLRWNLAGGPSEDQLDAAFQERRRACPGLRHALVVLIGEEARSRRLQNPYFAAYFIARPAAGSAIMPGLKVEVIADWRTVPDQASARFGRALTALVMRDWKEAKEDLVATLNALAETHSPGSQRPPWAEFVKP